MSRTSQKNSSTKSVRPATAKHRLGNARDRAQQADWLAALEFARQFVPFIVASGPIPSFENCIDAPSQVAELVGRQGKLTYNLDDLGRELDQLLKRLGGHVETDVVGDLVFRYLTAALEAGYVVGVAVGQTLGRDVLNGSGAR